MVPVTPDRFRAPLIHTIDDAMPAAFALAAGRWLYEQRDRMARTGDDDGQIDFQWCRYDIDKANPELFGPLRKRVLDALPAAVAACAVPPFDPVRIELAATLYHHGCHAGWHRGCGEYDHVAESAALGFAFTMHSEPKLFSGGELEFLDGTAIEPKHNRLTLFAPGQVIRVRSVECWSAHVLHGRWALVGILHAR